MSIEEWENALDERDIKMDNRFRKEFAYQFKGFKSGDNTFYPEVSIGEGWWSIVKAMCFEVDAFLVATSHQDKFTWRQIKEKFGVLRAYYSCPEASDGVLLRISEIVCKYEDMSTEICEKCGKPGKVRHDGWIKTLCDEHEEKRQEQMRRYEDG